MFYEQNIYVLFQSIYSVEVLIVFALPVHIYVYTTLSDIIYILRIVYMNMKYIVSYSFIIIFNNANIPLTGELPKQIRSYRDD